MLKTERKGKWLEIIVPQKWRGLTIEDLFKKVWCAPKKLTHEFRTEKKVLVNGDVNWHTTLEPGKKIQLNLFNEKNSDIPPSYLNVPTLYEDDHLIVFNKPPFMNTHPNHLETDTLLNAAVFHLQQSGEMGSIRHIHRLDRDTSGAILFAKHSLAGALLDQAMENRNIKRTYIALVHGKLPSKKGIINAPIGRDRHHSTRRRVSPSGQEAVTHYQLVKEDKEKGLSYVKCWLETGRTHQIRVHMSYIGHPLAGDIVYGGQPIFPRQALHAAKLEFIHPITEEQIVCFAPFLDIPPIFKEINMDSI
ncbi:MAG: RluA family pseudouridine synthase [Bacillota bacterium]|nr:RluA family pseudouridine synthase [Bacillota bacterium]